jgi:membrane fusion protein, multidrug efflux system
MKSSSSEDHSGIHGMRRNLASLSFLLALVAAGCSSESRTAVSAQQVSPQGGRGGGGASVPVTIARASKKTMPLDLRVIGSVEPASTVEIRAQTTGLLTSVGFKEGDDVKQGDVLFSLDRRPLEAAVRQAEANLQRDVAQSANAQVQAQRLSDLAERGIVSRDQMETSKATAAALAGTIEADRAAVENARIQLQYATINAPITGRTGALIVHAGSLVRANDTTPMVVVNQLAPINVTFAVPEAQLPALKQYMARGSVAIVAQPPGDTQPSVGQLVFVDNAIDPTTGTIKAKGSFTNADHRLWPGQYVNVTMTLGVDRDAIVVPTPAVQTGPDGQYVFVIKSDQTADLRNVKVGRTIGSETIVTSGLNADDTVVTDGQLRLTPGTRVTIKNAGGNANAEKAGS